MASFSGLSLAPPLLKAVGALGYDEMTAIQAASLPVMLAGQDVLAQAKTGSGKTAAFGLALLSALQSDQVRLQSLVLCPTRELADQVSKQLRALARFIPNVKVLSLCGGVPIRAQLSSLSHEPHIVVGTPGRIEDLIGRKALKLDGLQSVILDEADRMLDMGFHDAINRILAGTPASRKTWLFSATYPDEIRDISKRFQNAPTQVTVDEQHDETVIKQLFFEVSPDEKAEAVMTLLASEQPEQCLIFCNTKRDARELTQTLARRYVSAIALHGDLDQRDRDEAMVQFANGSRRVMVATDVAARGLDIQALPLVIAYELPNDPDVHVHRVGRTGRAGETGLALNLVANRERGRLPGIEGAIGSAVVWEELPELTDDSGLPKSTMRTLVIDGGRKDKLRPGDMLGALTGIGGLKASQVGKIDVFPTRTYVAVEQQALHAVHKNLNSGKIKGRRFRVRKI